MTIKRRSRGFTLLELMVTVVIIGIITAIAVPVYLNQKRAAWDASVESDVRNAALAINTEDASNGTGDYHVYKADDNGSMTGTESTSTLDIGDADATSTDARTAATVDNSNGRASIAYITRGNDKSGTRISVTTGNVIMFRFFDNGNYIIYGFSSLNGRGTNPDGTPNYTGQYHMLSSINGREIVREI